LELLQEGVAGLLVAARRYDTTLTTPFWAYASFWVRKAMQELVAELTRPVALSDRAVRELAQIRRARSEHLQAAASKKSVSDEDGSSARSSTEATASTTPQPGISRHARDSVPASGLPVS
jgi:DNA-directed RNA polymerase sigma subunit (sigma70/sigma32)